jgi:hypothetical protein
MKNGIELIAEERQRQIEKEGWSFEHDAMHDSDELAFAAVAYALPYETVDLGDDDTLVNPVIVKIRRIKFWPWEWNFWRPSPKNRVRELVKAGALIAAEIDRIQAKKIKTQS